MILNWFIWGSGWGRGFRLCRSGEEAEYRQKEQKYNSFGKVPWKSIGQIQKSIPAAKADFHICEYSGFPYMRITEVKFDWKMPLEILRANPVKIHWASDNPLAYTAEK